MVSRTARPIALAASVLLAAASARAADVTKETVTSRSRPRVYYLFIPSSAPADRPAPLIVTIHGSTRNGKTLVDAWKDLAEKEGIVLAGPDSTDAVHWASPQDGPLLLRDVVDAVAAKRAIDPRRVYLFGHSAGAVFALQMACLESEYFAAAAVHAGAVDPQYFSIFDYAARKIPIAIWIGTRDEFFPIDGVRATAKALETRGFPVTLTEIPNHNHNYSAVSKDLNVKIWEFLSAQKLPGDSKYRVYADPN
ncbi:MAG TPA: PHB depolymerase family esterase [Thermoanaerobaculia bacterium]|nr:PHB depolymerase family esterase [Thermoanaerobaculia bacterium]